MEFLNQKPIGAQGEIFIYPVDQIPEGESHSERLPDGRPIISHSENGNHHVINRPCAVIQDPQVGAEILYAIVDQPSMLIQDASNAHEAHDLPPGKYAFVKRREYDPFADEIRRVAD